MQPIVEIQLSDPAVLRKHKKDKFVILDILAKDAEGKIYNVEIQNQGDETFKLRALYYWAKKYSGQIKRGGKYEEAKPVISINIVDFNLIEETEDYHSVFRITQQNNPSIIFTDRFEMHIIELPKFVSTFDDTDKMLDIERWIWFLIYGGTKDNIMRQLARRDSGIRKATRVLSAFTESELKQHIRDSREKYELDKIAYMDLGIKKGRAEGKAEGLAEGEAKGEARGLAKGLAKGSLAAKIETARNMLAEKFPIEQIAKLTGLSLSEVKKLKDSD